MEQGNPARRIKRNVIARRHSLFAVAPPGLETVCRDELLALGQGVVVEQVVPGGVAFSGHLTDLYRANLHLRSVGRILLRLAQFKATNFDQLTIAVTAMPWAWYLPEGCLPLCRVTAHRSRLYHSAAVAERVAAAVAAYWRRSGVEPAGALGQQLFVRLEEDRVLLSLDSSGENLYRRGIKLHPGRAPLRETLAAAILLRAGYQSKMSLAQMSLAQMPLIDPMCGTGSFALEAALMAKNIPPGWLREFAFMQWPAFRPLQWGHLKRVVERQRQVLAPAPILAADIDQAACDSLRECVARNGLEDAVQVVCRDFFTFSPTDLPKHMRTGLLVLNPPYGLRLGAAQDLKTLYRNIGQKLRHDFKGWLVALLVAQTGLIRFLPGGLQRTPVRHGGLALQLLTGRIR